MFGLNYETVVPVIVGAIGVVYGYLQTGKLKDTVGVIQKFAEQSVTYMGIRADGTITVEEKVKMGEAAIAFFESVEQMAGVPIVNTPAVAWIKPAVDSTPVELTTTFLGEYTKGDDPFTSLGVKVLPVRQAGISPFTAEFQIISSTLGKKYIIDFGDGQSENGDLVNGMAMVKHTYSYAKSEKYSGTTYLPIVTVISADGLATATGKGAFYVMVDAP